LEKCCSQKNSFLEIEAKKGGTWFFVPSISLPARLQRWPVQTDVAFKFMQGALHQELAYTYSTVEQAW
jgi:hypothetical protein